MEKSGKLNYEFISSVNCRVRDKQAKRNKRVEVGVRGKHVD